MPKFNLSLRDRIIIAVIILLTILIPTGSYVLSLRYKTESQAQEYKAPVTNPKTEATNSSRLQDALDRLNQSQNQTQNQTAGEGSPVQTRVETGVDDSTSGVSNTQLVFGPTLGFSLILQGRPLDNQSTQAFLGIAAGLPTTRPTYLLSFMVNVPASGSFDGISLSGLDTGATYTAYIKGDAQIATSSAFVVKATPTNLGTLNLSTGDINEDNVIDNLDYNLVKAAMGAYPSSTKWNPLYDFNRDGIINSWDLNLVLSNTGKIGDSGAWYSYTPLATASATTSGGPVRSVSQSDAGGPTSSNQAATASGTPGLWMWIPGI